MSFDYSVDACLKKAVNAYFKGMSRDHADCHALVGRLIHLNEEKLLEDPDAKIAMYLLPSGLVAHSALIYKGKIHDNPRHIGGEQNRWKYRYSADIPIKEFLSMTKEMAPEYNEETAQGESPGDPTPS